MISCKCITYGRTHLLQEALYSFLQQDGMEESELIIVNDYPLQTLIFDHPNVKIFNLKETFKTIGDKENFAIEQCSGDIIAVWDDDDIALPNHLSNIKKFWKEDTNILHWAKGVYYNYPNITDIPFIGNSGMVYSRKAWEAVGRSPIMNAGGDTVFKDDIHALGADKIVFAYPPLNEVSWFYRWSLPQIDGNPAIFHQSGLGEDVPHKPNIIQRHSAYIEQQRIKGLIPTGEIILQPHWNQSYDVLLKDYVNRISHTNI